MHNSREVITFQFGNYANYIGAHWWNLQEAGFNYDTSDSPNPINHDVLYRQGVTNKDWVTYTPRLLLVDLDGSLKHLPVEGELYGGSAIKRDADDVDRSEAIKKLRTDLVEVHSENKLEVIESPAIEPHAYQRDLVDPTVDVHNKDYQLASSVDSWADYLYTRYHPRTVHVVREYKHASDSHNLDTYSCGEKLWKSEQFEDDFCDHIRQYVEECDYLQGFQTLFDCDNGFSGLAGKCMEYLNDEYRKANFAVPVYQPRNIRYDNADGPMSDSIRVVNSALCFKQLIEQSSLFTPLSTQTRVWRQLGLARQWQGMNYSHDNLYQTSAILASYLDTITLRYRLRDATHATSSLGGFCADLTNYGRRLAAAALALPFPMEHDEDLIDCLDRFDGELFTQLTPNCKIGTDYVVQSLCVRGIPENRLKRPLEQAQRQMRMAAYKCDRVSEMFQLYLQCKCHASMAHVSAIETSMRTQTPYPLEIFADASLNSSGFRSGNSEQVKLKSVPVLATIQSSGDISDMIETLHREAKRINIAKLHRFQLGGLEADDYGEALEQLLLFKDNYDDNYDL